jgi:GAF domain-containing protein
MTQGFDMDEFDGLTGLAQVSAMLVTEQDLSGVVATGIAEAARAVGADGAGVLLVVPGRDELDVLASTSHVDADLEAYQAAVLEGPCAETVRTQRPVVVGSSEDAEQRWPAFAGKMRAAGYARAYSVPMRWQGTGVGGLNLFWREPGSEPDEHTRQLMQTFADILTIAVVHVHAVSPGLALERVQGALAARSIVEQAKGVLSHQRDLSMDTAFTELVAIGRERHLSLGEAARLVIETARRGETV